MKIETLKKTLYQGFVFVQKSLARLAEYLKTSWKSAVVIVPSLLVLYYVFGSFLSENIDKNLKFEIKKQEHGYTFVETSADLIKREIDEHMFTPNLPFIFPASVLDNMPSFQKGIFEALSNVLNQISAQITSKEFQKANEFLKYPPNVWLFSKTKDFKLEPSSTAQYRKARRNLLKFNETSQTDLNVLKKVLSAVEQDLQTAEQMLTKQIDVRAYNLSDDVFYRVQGHLYADYLLLKSVNVDMPFNFVLVQKPLENGLKLQPKIVRNGKLGSTFAPNHLVELAYFTLKSKQALNFVLEGGNNAD